MTESVDRLKGFARSIMESHAHDVGYLSIFEMLEGTYDIDDVEARTVLDLIRTARISIRWDTDKP